jgi:hypothetical protein
VAIGDEDVPARRDSHALDELRQLPKREVHREHAEQLIVGVDDRHRARDAEVAGLVERVRIGPHAAATFGGGLEVRPLARPVAVIVGGADERSRGIRRDRVFLHVDLAAPRITAVDVHGAAGVAPRADEAVLDAPVADPREPGVGAQRREHEALELRFVHRIELAARHEIRTELHGVLGAPQELVGLIGGKARRLHHDGLEQRARGRAVLAPCEHPDGAAGERGEAGDEQNHHDPEGGAPAKPSRAKLPRAGRLLQHRGPHDTAQSPDTDAG